MDQLLEHIERAVSDARQMSLVEPDYVPLEKACVEFLKVRSYGIHFPIRFYTKIKRLEGLATHFNNLYGHQYPDFIPYSSSEDEERKIASEFVNNRMRATGLSFEAALQQCGEIIRTVFMHLDDFEFTVPLAFGMFAQKKMIWVTNKAIKIMNKKKDMYETENLRKLAEETMRWKAQHSKPGWTQEEIDKIHNRHKEKVNGKEKEKGRA